ncbi:MAG: hypothetical protein Q7U04_16740 [Bacteriovorax sp.]|nr:hypothetical protein [Bacteriovorax sp.]
MTISSILIILVQSINFSAHAQVFYELKDLEVLEKEKNFEEFLLHVNDIRPSERARHWKDMYQNIAVGLVDYKIKTRDFSILSYRQIEQIERSSALSSDELFQFKRSLFAKKYFTECFRKAALVAENIDKNTCADQLNSFWIFSKKDPDMGMDLAIILEANNTNISLWPYYEVVVRDSVATLYCKKANVQQAVMNKLYGEVFSAEFSGDYKSLVNKIIPESCFNEMVLPLKEMLTSIKSNGLEKEMALNILESKGKLSQEESDLFAVLYLLDGPVVGDKMNIAWKKIEALGENFTKRQKLLTQIEKLPIIPDKIFKDPNLPRHKAIINLFAKNFPEYLNYYGLTCIKFITNSGTQSQNVSSSYQCNEFLKAAQTIKKESKGQSTPWISDSVESQYSGIKK